MPYYIIYARKSTESEERQVASIESQINELRLVAARRGLAIGDLLTESHSAKAPGRPVFKDLMTRIEKGQVQGILCWKMDRLARNHFDTGLILQALADRKIESVITPERTYTADGTDRFLGTFELGMATKYIDDLRANVLRGNRNRFERGWPNFRPPIGYLEDHVAKTIVIDPLRFGLVRRMWELLLSGSFQAMDIWRMAVEDWHLTTTPHGRMGGKPLRRSSVYNIFSNPFYAGRIVLRSGKSYPGAHPPMVTEEEFQRARHFIGRSSIRPEKHDFAYPGIFRCPCGLNVCAEVHVKKSGKRYVYYHCTRSRHDGRCMQPAIPERDLVAQLLSAAGKLSIHPALHSWLSKHVTDTFAREGEHAMRVRKAIALGLESVQLQQRTLLELRLRGQVAEGEYGLQGERLMVEAFALQRRTSHLEALPAGSRGFRSSEFAARVQSVISHGTTKQQRVCAAALWAERIIDQRQVRLTPAPALSTGRT